MGLPVSAAYLALALEKEITINDITLRERNIADLHLPTGKLIASDAIVFMDPLPFKLKMPTGTFPVILSIAHIAEDQRVAFARIRFRDTVPVTWKMLSVEGEPPGKLQEGDIFGYGVDSGTGCFIDASAAKVFDEKLTSDPNYFENLLDAIERTYVNTWGWLDLPFGKGNLVAFSSGFGDGFYATYAGFDADGKLAVVVTDFAVVPSKAE
ncbi:hypothetical protein Enr10x_36970 [Gimesia panareensis]|uniref:DUF4241 domain-containing protein n=2 Tax=Gimesia panareensis TaxID=2527978 RepID=A0A517Q9S5_9PLAN|nr:hypothetical protein Enr10x_36970 [Gimesia panareensis]